MDLQELAKKVDAATDWESRLNHAEQMRAALGGEYDAFDRAYGDVLRENPACPNPAERALENITAVIPDTAAVSKSPPSSAAVVIAMIEDLAGAPTDPVFVCIGGKRFRVARAEQHADAILLMCEE